MPNSVFQATRRRRRWFTRIETKDEAAIQMACGVGYDGNWFTTEAEGRGGG